MLFLFFQKFSGAIDRDSNIDLTVGIVFGKNMDRTKVWMLAQFFQLVFIDNRFSEVRMCGDNQ